MCSYNFYYLFSTKVYQFKLFFIPLPSVSIGTTFFIHVFQLSSGAHRFGPSSGFPRYVSREQGWKWGSQDSNHQPHGMPEIVAGFNCYTTAMATKNSFKDVFSET